MIDKCFCMSSFLMYRYVYDLEKTFFESIHPKIVDLNFERADITNAEELLFFLKNEVQKCTKDGKTALALSGGIDSAILAKLMPEGSTAYTFRCVVPGKKVIDETALAAEYARRCHLKHQIIDISWNDVCNVVDFLMLHKGAPVHSIECQIYIAGKRAKKEGFGRCLYGENADIIYGGMNKLLQKDWLYSDFIERYAYIMPYRVLRDSILITKPFMEFEKDGHIDAYAFTNKYFRQESLGSYDNACQAAGVEFIAPFAKTRLAIPLDLQRIRSGDTKYLVREVFKRLYPDMPIPEKTPMPRPVTEWLANWAGPSRPEFIPHSTDSFTGDQRWMVWVLEKFLNLVEKNQNNV